MSTQSIPDLRYAAFRDLLTVVEAVVASQSRLRFAFGGPVAELDAALIQAGEDVDRLTAAWQTVERVRAKASEGKES